MKWAAIGLLAVVLSWQDNSGNEDGFFIEKTVSGDCITGFELWAFVGVNVTSVTDDLAVPGACYRVAAFNDVGPSGYSNTAQVQAETGNPCKNKRSKHCR